MGVFNAKKTTLWSQRMAAFEASGQSRRSWCKAQGLSVSTFGYWRAQLRHRTSAAAPASARATRSRGAADKRTTIATTLVPVVVRSASAPAPTSAHAATAVELVWPNGLRLTTSLGVSELAALVRVLSC